MSKYGFIRFLKGLWRLVDVPGWQKWFGAAVLGFVFVLPSGLSIYQFQGILVGVSLVFCFNQSINDCFDVEIDKKKEEVMGKRLIVSSIMPRWLALSITVTILFAGLASTLLASVNLFFTVLLMALLGTIYSVPPLRFKQQYPFSTLVQFVGCFLPFLAGVTTLSMLTPHALLISSLFSFLAMTYRFEHEIENYSVDLMTNKKTVAVVHGRITARRLSKLCLFVGLAEFALFFALGWFSRVFLLMFILYIFVCIIHSKWLRYLPRYLRTVILPVLTVGGVFLFFLAFLIHPMIIV